MLELLSAVFLFFGILVYITGIIGIIRLPDVYNRLHAITKMSFVGVLSVTLSGLIYFGNDPLSIKSIAIVIFLSIAYPVSGHLLARAAYRTRVPTTEKILNDGYKDLKKIETDTKKE